MNSHLRPRIRRVLGHWCCLSADGPAVMGVAGSPSVAYIRWRLRFDALAAAVRAA